MLVTSIISFPYIFSNTPTTKFKFRVTFILFVVRKCFQCGPVLNFIIWLRVKESFLCVLGGGGGRLLFHKYILFSPAMVKVIYQDHIFQKGLLCVLEGGGDSFFTNTFCFPWQSGCIFRWLNHVTALANLLV